MLKRISVIFLVVLLTLPLGGCTTKESKTVHYHTITNIDGSKIEVPDNIQKIAAIYGPAYEAMEVLGVESKIVVCADVQFENFPWAKKIFKRINSLPYLKDVHSAVNTEELMNYHPDISFTFPRPNELKQLKSIGIAAVSGITTGNLIDTKNQLTVYAKAIGCKTALLNAKKYSDYFDEKLSMIKKITDNIPSNEKPTVYYAGTDILTTYGKYSDLPELISIAGGISVSSKLEAGNRTQINTEQLINWNPDFIFIDHGGINGSDSVEKIKADFINDTRYKNIAAVLNKQIYLTPSGVFYWDMGLQKILLLMQMAKILHPKEFSNLDMVSEIKTFYSLFFHYNLTNDEADKILNREAP